jgi:hypothetical protein
VLTMDASIHTSAPGRRCLVDFHILPMSVLMLTVKSTTSCIAMGKSLRFRQDHFMPKASQFSSQPHFGSEPTSPSAADEHYRAGPQHGPQCLKAIAA